MTQEETGNPNRIISAEKVSHQTIANHAKWKMLVANHLARKGTSPKCAIFERMWTTWTKNQKESRTKNVTSLCHRKSTIFFFEKLQKWRTFSYFNTWFLFIFWTMHKLIQESWKFPCRSNASLQRVSKQLWSLRRIFSAPIGTSSPMWMVNTT